jgi:hypothetical protein
VCGRWTVRGSIDRVTGTLEATTQLFESLNPSSL